jgi:hypothetical protein
VGIVVGVLVALVGLVACGSDTGLTLTPIPGDGTIAMPRRPVIVDPLPAGWSVREVKTSQRRAAMASAWWSTEPKWVSSTQARFR